MAAVVSALLVVQACIAPAGAAGDQTVTLALAGGDRTYVLHLPPDPRGPLPLMLVFHGANGDAAAAAYATGFDAVADRLHFIVAYPNGANGHWNDARTTAAGESAQLAFVAALVADVGRRAAIDRARVYAAGISNGAMFAEFLACRAPATFAAIAAVAGTLRAADRDRCARGRPVSVLQIAGSADPIMPYGGGPVGATGDPDNLGVVSSVDATLAFWLQRDGCSRASHSVDLVPLAPDDGTHVVRTTYRCASRARVELVRIVGGGHGWPGPSGQYAPVAEIGTVSTQYDATAEIARFFGLTAR